MWQLLCQKWLKNLMLTRTGMMLHRVKGLSPTMLWKSSTATTILGCWVWARGHGGTATHRSGRPSHPVGLARCCGADNPPPLSDAFRLHLLQRSDEKRLKSSLVPP